MHLVGFIIRNGKVKFKIVPLHIMKAYGGIKGLAAVFLNLGCRLGRTGHEAGLDASEKR